MKYPKKRDHRDHIRGSVVAEDDNDDSSNNGGGAAYSSSSSNMGQPCIKRLRGNDEDH